MRRSFAYISTDRTAFEGSDNNPIEVKAGEPVNEAALNKLLEIGKTVAIVGPGDQPRLDIPNHVNVYVGPDDMITRVGYSL